jgi:hypothetical protein
MTGDQNYDAIPGLIHQLCAQHLAIHDALAASPWMPSIPDPPAGPPLYPPAKIAAANQVIWRSAQPWLLRLALVSPPLGTDGIACLPPTDLDRIHATQVRTNLPNSGNVQGITLQTVMWSYNSILPTLIWGSLGSTR